ncbi:putative serine/threonine-protein kinase iks1 [Gonapodya sp. JEL0774]|nr:putative serine/threonine-protein kinase iks1 [Gonapodya sp. JEL0774]
MAPKRKPPAKPVADLKVTETDNVQGPHQGRVVYQQTAVLANPLHPISRIANRARALESDGPSSSPTRQITKARSGCRPHLTVEVLKVSEKGNAHHFYYFNSLLVSAVSSVLPVVPTSDSTIRPVPAGDLAPAPPLAQPEERLALAPSTALGPATVLALPQLPQPGSRRSRRVGKQAIEYEFDDNINNLTRRTRVNPRDSGKDGYSEPLALQGVVFQERGGANNDRKGEELASREAYKSAPTRSEQTPTVERSDHGTEMKAPTPARRVQGADFASGNTVDETITLVAERQGGFDQGAGADSSPGLSLDSEDASNSKLPVNRSSNVELQSGVGSPNIAFAADMTPNVHTPLLPATSSLRYPKTGPKNESPIILRATATVVSTPDDTVDELVDPPTSTVDHAHDEIENPNERSMLSSQRRLLCPADGSTSRRIISVTRFKISTTSGTRQTANRETERTKSANVLGHGQADQNTGFAANNFELGRRLGTGGSGSVFEARQRVAGVAIDDVALKIIGVGTDHRLLHAGLNEVKIMKGLKDRSILGYKFTWVEDEFRINGNGAPTQCLFIALDRANGGSLDTLLSPGKASAAQWKAARKAQTQNPAKYHDHLSRGGTLYVDPNTGIMTRTLTSQEIQHCFSSIAKSLKYIHSRGVVHYDVKPGNFLLHFPNGAPASLFCEWRDDDTTPQIVLTDFGESLVMPKLNLNTARGTMEYMAPELLLGGTFDADSKADMWSLGVTMYEVSTGRLPWNAPPGDIESFKLEVSSFVGP